jgi:uncharacterized membrane protein
MRFWELDALRGSAIILMVVSNFITDLQFFLNYSEYPTFWFIFARITASIFILLVGICLTISYSKLEQKNIKKYIKRGSYLFSLGLIITAITFLFIPKDYIRFGILHFIGLSVILAYPFLKSKNKIIFPSALFVFILFALTKNIQLSSSYLLWLGVTSQGFSSVDYFPILPWFALILSGIIIGNKFYIGANPTSTNKLKMLQALGKKSLLIYFLHQPILLSLIFAYIKYT